MQPNAFDPEHPRPYFVTEDGEFGGWMSDRDIEEHWRQMEAAALAQIEAEDIPKHAADIRDIGKTNEVKWPSSLRRFSVIDRLLRL